MKRAILWIAIVTIGCANENDFNPGDRSYFPLHIGDSWLYEPANELYPAMNDHIPIVSKKIVGTSSIEGGEYFLMITTSEYQDRTLKDSTYYRLDQSTGFVYEYNSWNPQLMVNEFRLNANVGDQWSSSRLSTEDDMRLSSISTVQIHDTPIENCKEYFYDVIHMADEEHYTTLGPGLGIVAQGNVWGFNIKLKKATINGQSFKF